MMLLVVTMVSAVSPFEPDFTGGLTIRMNDLDDHPLNTPLYLYSYIYDTTTGVLLNDSICKIDLHYGINLDEIYEVENITTRYHILNETLFNRTGTYQSDIYCTSANGLQGGFNQVQFTVSEETAFGIWKPVED